MGCRSTHWRQTTTRPVADVRPSKRKRSGSRAQVSGARPNQAQSLKPGARSLQRGARSQLVLFLFAVFALKLVIVLQLKDHVLTQPDAGLDTTAYVALAQRVLDGDLGLGPGLYFVSPLYIYFLAGVLALIHSFTLARVVQIMLGTCAVGLVFFTAEQWFGRRAAWLAAGLAALTGLFTFYESLLLQAALDPFLTAAALACLTIGLRQSHARWMAFAGVVLGVQSLNRPNVAVVAAAIAVLLAGTRRWRAASVFAAGMVIALAPVTLRNVAVADSWTPVSSQGGLNFYIGNNDKADGTYQDVAGVTPNLQGQQEDARRVASRAAGRPLNDAETSSYFYSLGVKWARDHPGLAAKLFVRKLSLVINAAPIWLNYSYRFFARDAGTWIRALIVGPWLLIPFGVVGLVVAAPRAMRSEYVIWASFAPLYAIAVALFFVADRYTLPLLIPLAIGAGASFDALLAAARQWRRLAVAATAVVALFVIVNRDAGVDDGRAEERTRMAERLVTLNRGDEAEQWAERAANASPRPGLVHFRVGQRLLAAGQSAAAIPHFEKASRFDASQPEVELVLGEALLDVERARDAVPHLRRALDAGFHREVAGPDLVRALGASGDSAEAVTVLKTLRGLVQHDAEGSAALGELAMQLREPLLAEAYFRQAVSVRPDLARAHFGLAAAAASTGRLAEARREAQETLRLDPHFEQAEQLEGLLK
jgi:tetratricopeptide (TPR) repeat protein